MENQIIYTSKRKPEYSINLTREELEAIPVLVNMATIYSWELYKKTKEDKFYEQHKENIDLIKNYHDKGYQGILAVGSFIESKIKQLFENMELNKVLDQYINKNELKIQDEDCLSVKDFKGDEVLHIEYDYTAADMVDQVVKLVKYINERS